MGLLMRMLLTKVGMGLFTMESWMETRKLLSRICSIIGAFLLNFQLYSPSTYISIFYISETKIWNGMFGGVVVVEVVKREDPRHHVLAEELRNGVGIIASDQCVSRCKQC